MGKAILMQPNRSNLTVLYLYPHLTLLCCPIAHSVNHYIKLLITCSVQPKYVHVYEQMRIPLTLTIIVQSTNVQKTIHWVHTVLDHLATSTSEFALARCVRMTLLKAMSYSRNGCQCDSYIPRRSVTMSFTRCRDSKGCDTAI